MHLAWFLTGSYTYAQAAGKTKKLEDLAKQTFDLLLQNQGKNGYFSHLAYTRSLQAGVRGWMGSFADQVYPIYGMTQFYNAFGDSKALEPARLCAMAICEAQGSLGQWWGGHYDARNGTVFEKYPVFSVHQHGMAPMTLLPLGKALGESFDQWIYKGLEWIDRRNELSVNMEDSSADVIWRCIRQSRLHRLSSALMGERRGSTIPKGCRSCTNAGPTNWAGYSWTRRTVALSRSSDTRKRSTRGTGESEDSAAGSAAVSCIRQSHFCWIVTGILMWILPQRKVIIPFLLVAILIPEDQVLVIAGVHFPLLRILLLFGIVRIFILKGKGEWKIFSGGMNKIDKSVILLALTSTTAGVLLFRTPQALIFQLLSSSSFGLTFCYDALFVTVKT